MWEKYFFLWRNVFFDLRKIGILSKLWVWTWSCLKNEKKHGVKLTMYFSYTNNHRERVCEKEENLGTDLKKIKRFLWFSLYHRLNRLKMFIWAPCAQLYLFAETPSSPAFGLIYEGRYWSAKIDDLSLWPLGLYHLLVIYLSKERQGNRSLYY